MPDEKPTLVAVTNVVETKPVDGTTDPPKPPTVESTTETHKVEKVTGEAGQLPPPQIIADDNARKWLAVGVILQFLALVGFMVYLTLRSGRAVDPAQMMILGAEIGFVTTVLNYYFGSSSGSTAKSAVMEKKP